MSEPAGYFTRLPGSFGEAAFSFLTLDASELAAGAPDEVTAGWRLWASGDALHRAGDYERAVSLLQSAQAVAARHPGARALWAEVHHTVAAAMHDHGDLWEARAALTQARATFVALAEEAAGAARSQPGVGDGALFDEIRAMTRALDRDHGESVAADTDPDHARGVLVGWLRERALPGVAGTTALLLRCAAAVDMIDVARTSYHETVAWIWREILHGDPDPGRLWGERFAAVRDFLIKLAFAYGDVEAVHGDAERSAEVFAEAIALLDEHATTLADTHMLLQLRVNRANSLLRLGRYDEALKIYEWSRWGFEGMGDAHAALRVEHAMAVARAKRDAASADAGADTRAIVRGYEHRLAEIADQRNLHVAKVEAMPAYQLFITQLAGGGDQPVGPRANDYLRVLKAMRQGEALSNVADEPDPETAADWKALGRRLSGPVWTLAARLERLPETVVLVIEPGVDAVTLLVLEGGTAPLEERLILTTGSVELAAALEALAREHFGALAELLTEAGAVHPPAGERFVAAGERAWQLFPDDVRVRLARSQTILYSPSPAGNLDEVPLELLRTPDGWLGTTHAVARQPSLRTLEELLAPNRTASALADRALIVRAGEPAGYGGLPLAAQEEKAAQRWARALGFGGAEVSEAPAAAELLEQLDTGYRWLHYIGHGAADELTEGLPLGRDRDLKPRDLWQLSGHRTPIMLLSACETGRSRYGAGGRHVGIVSRLIEKGAPAVVASLHPVPDAVAFPAARELYRAARDQPLGRALCAARAALDAAGVHPACWGMYGLSGDPFVRVAPASGRLAQARELTETWAAHLTRYAAARTPADRLRCREGLARAVEAAPPAHRRELGRASAWVEDAFVEADEALVAERVELALRIADRDLTGAVALRVLAAAESLERSADTAAPGFWSEIGIGMSLSAAMFDLPAWAAFAARAGWEGFGTTLDMATCLQYLREAEGVLAGWAAHSPEFHRLHAQVAERAALLGEKRIFDVGRMGLGAVE